MSTLAQSHANTPVAPPGFAQAVLSKRAVNLTLSDGLVVQAKSFTNNLSGTVEALLSEFVATQQRAQATRQQQASGWCAEWNTVQVSVGSFADDHSTL